jgi:hypothetical protein
MTREHHKFLTANSRFIHIYEIVSAIKIYAFDNHRSILGRYSQFLGQKLYSFRGLELFCILSNNKCHCKEQSFKPYRWIVLWQPWANVYDY